MIIFSKLIRKTKKSKNIRKKRLNLQSGNNFDVTEEFDTLTKPTHETHYIISIIFINRAV